MSLKLVASVQSSRTLQGERGDPMCTCRVGGNIQEPSGRMAE